MIEITTPVGRMVGGHPMVSRVNKDDKTGLPKMQQDGVTPSTSIYVGLAIPKGAEQHWNQTEWGAIIWNEALAAWPNGEYQQPTFSWKIVDGDSQIPNKKMKKPCDREGYPGHWVIQASTGLGAVKCYNVGKYNPLTDLIQQKEMIKPGDYARLVLLVKGNNSTQTAGMYLNPSIFELYQPGQAIILENEPDAAGTLGATAAQLPAGALVDTNVPAQQPAAPGMAPPAQQPGMAPPQQQAAPPVQQQPPAQQPATPGMAPAQPGAAPIAPATDLLQPPVQMYLVEGMQYTGEQLKGFGWNDQQIATAQKV